MIGGNGGVEGLGGWRTVEVTTTDGMTEQEWLSAEVW